MFPSYAQRMVADKFVSWNLERPYLAAHVRRADFASYAHPDTTPDILIAAKTLINLRERFGMKSIFIATDATNEEKKKLEELVGGVVMFKQNLGHPGENAVVEQWICTTSDLFVGTQVSRFTLSIQEERDLLGIDPRRTWNHFCKDNPGKLCWKSNWYAESFKLPCEKRQKLYAETLDKIKRTDLVDTVGNLLSPLRDEL